MGWHVFQFGVVAACVLSNVAWKWTPNGHLPVMGGMLAAFLLTLWITNILRWLR